MVLTATFMTLRTKSAVAIVKEGFIITYPKPRPVREDTGARIAFRWWHVVVCHLCDCDSCIPFRPFDVDCVVFCSMLKVKRRKKEMWADSQDAVVGK
jgi:hypothetical protein